jgi:ATP phosphoribosyltransferase
MLDLAIPSKGRVQKPTLELLESIGAPMETPPGGARSYKASLKGIANCTIWLTPSNEIAKKLHAGEVHAGIVGIDLLHERGEVEGAIEIVKPLGYGRADMVVAVPQSWIDVNSIADLREVFHDIRLSQGRPALVATSFSNCTARIFPAWGLEDFRIVAMPGATEAAPANLLADVIVDITETGSTLKATHLKPLFAEPLIRSEVALAVSQKAKWDAQSFAALEALTKKLDPALSLADLKAKLGV